MDHVRSPKRVLIVDVDAEFVRNFQTYADAARLATCTRFQAARKALLNDRPDLLVTSLRLGAYNGLHLVYLAAANRLPTTSIVYDDPIDPVLAREAQRIGAFVESRQRIVRVFESYLNATLPPSDRRSVIAGDRRRRFRGGRRSGELRQRRDRSPMPG
jgi:DNA-binding NtrC family response regulator